MYVKAAAKFRKRLKKKRMARLEVHVRKDDVIRPPASRGQEQVTRALLSEHFGAGQVLEGPPDGGSERIADAFRTSQDD